MPTESAQIHKRLGMSYVEGCCSIALTSGMKVKNKTGGMGCSSTLLSTSGYMDIDMMVIYDHSSGLFGLNWVYPIIQLVVLFKDT